MSGWGDLSTGQKWGVGIGGVASILPALFGGGGDAGLGDSIKSLQKNASSATDTSKTLGGDSAAIFQSVLPYLKAAAGGDQAALNIATMPQRRKVIDQYDAARKSIAEFAPRSGGTAASMNEMRSQEASDLGGINAQARNDAVGQASGLGTSLASLGLSASGQASSDILGAANIQSELSKMQQQHAGSWGQALGGLAGLLFAL